MISKLNKNFLIKNIKKTTNINPINSSYIRPLAYFNKGGIGVSTKKKHPIKIIITCIKIKKYINSEKIYIKINKFIRINPKSTICDAKISGNYINSLLATNECKKTKYHESILLNSEGFITEGT